MQSLLVCGYRRTMLSPGPDIGSTEDCLEYKVVGKTS